MEDFSPAAQRALAGAANVCLSLNQSEIDTDHLLVGLIEGPGPISEQLAALGVRGDTVLTYVRGAHSHKENAAHGHVPFTDDLRQTLDRATKIARARRHTLAGPSALFVALVDQHDSRAVRILAQLGVDQRSLLEVAAAASDETD